MTKVSLQKLAQVGYEAYRATWQLNNRSEVMDIPDFRNLPPLAYNCWLSATEMIVRTALGNMVETAIEEVDVTSVAIIQDSAYDVLGIEMRE